jgi:hypothetical protein
VLAASVVWGNANRATAGGTGEPFARAANTYVNPETNPSAAFRQLFTGFMPPSAMVNPREQLLFNRDKGVLAATRADCNRLKDSLGAEGVRLLEEHCSTLSNLEQRLVQPRPPAASACTVPPDPGQNATHWTNRDNMVGQTDAFWDLTAAALACELTHVVGYQFGGQAARNQLPASLGVPTAPTQDSGDSGPAHHPWTHNAHNDTKIAALRVFYRAYADGVARLIDRLKSTRDVAGQPLINSTMVLWLSEMGGFASNRDNHMTACSPVLVFGGPNVIRGNRYLRGPSPEAKTGAGVVEAGRQGARLLVSAFHHMGFTDVNTVGAANVTGPLTTLR